MLKVWPPKNDLNELKRWRAALDVAIADLQRLIAKKLEHTARVRSPEALSFGCLKRRSVGALQAPRGPVRTQYGCRPQQPQH